MKNVTGKFFGNPSNTAQLTSPFSSYLMVPSNNSDGFVKYDFLLQNQCCVFSNIFSQYLSVPFFIIVYCYFVQDRCPPLLTCSFTHFYPTLSKKKTKNIAVALHSPHSVLPFFAATADSASSQILRKFWGVQNFIAFIGQCMRTLIWKKK